MDDNVNHPKHYTRHPSGIECIDVTQHMNFCLGNAFKYIWRADLKNNDIEDLEKAVWYIQQEITRRKNEDSNIRHRDGRSTGQDDEVPLHSTEMVWRESGAGDLRYRHYVSASSGDAE